MPTPHLYLFGAPRSTTHTNDPAREALLEHLGRSDGQLPGELQRAYETGSFLPRDYLVELGLDSLSVPVAQGCILRGQGKSASIPWTDAPEPGLVAKLHPAAYDAARHAQRRIIYPESYVGVLAGAALGATLGFIVIGTAAALDKLGKAPERRMISWSWQLAGTWAGCGAVMLAAVFACAIADRRSGPSGPCNGSVDVNLDHLAASHLHGGYELRQELAKVGALRAADGGGHDVLVSLDGVDEAVELAGARVSPRWTPSERAEASALLRVAYAENRRVDLLREAARVMEHADVLKAKLEAPNGDDSEGLMEAMALAYVHGATLRGRAEKYGDLTTTTDADPDAQLAAKKAERRFLERDTRLRLKRSLNPAALTRFLRGMPEMQRLEAELATLEPARTAAPTAQGQSPSSDDVV